MKKTHGLKTIIKNINLGLALLVALSLIFCKSSEKKERVIIPDEVSVGNSSQIKDSEGRVIGKYTQVAANRSLITYFDAQGKVEREVEVIDNKVHMIIIDEDRDGKVDQVVDYNNNKPQKIDFLEKGSSQVKSRAYVDESGKTVKSVDVLSKNKRVFFAADGSIEKVEDIKP